jgi:DNA repair exonuclease SbcCD ATPase subunit
MLDLTDDTNKFLEILGSPFSVSIDKDTLGYLFSMNDGSGPETPMPAEALSGGQKVLLAVAFRLASYCMFAGKYGLLSLDEPTAYLDDANVANFCTLLESIKSTAVSMDLQILISTHERSVLPYLDSVLDIDAEKA